MYPENLFVALRIQHAMRMRHIDMDVSHTRVLHIKVLTNDVMPFKSHGRCYARA
jgi:hypothetical protein